ncbi:MAG: hypothetical protein PVI54_12260 [Desulfobacteraceae bacterium]|jgi:hypothetical protein
MLSSSFNICEFIDKVKGHSDQEIIFMADQEATKAERHLYKNYPEKQLEYARSYVALLKDVILYMRHGIRTQAVRRIDLPRIDPVQIP